MSSTYFSFLILLSFLSLSISEKPFTSINSTNTLKLQMAFTIHLFFIVLYCQNTPYWVHTFSTLSHFLLFLCVSVTKNSNYHVSSHNIKWELGRKGRSLPLGNNDMLLHFTLGWFKQWGQKQRLTNSTWLHEGRLHRDSAIWKGLWIIRFFFFQGYQSFQAAGIIWTRHRVTKLHSMFKED